MSLTPNQTKMRDLAYLWAYATTQIGLINTVGTTNSQVTDTIVANLAKSAVYTVVGAETDVLVDAIVDFVRQSSSTYTPVVQKLIAYGPPAWGVGPDHPSIADLDAIFTN